MELLVTDPNLVIRSFEPLFSLKLSYNQINTESYLKSNQGKLNIVFPQHLHHAQSVLMQLSIGIPDGQFRAAVDALSFSQSPLVDGIINSLLCYYNIHKEQSQPPYKKHGTCRNRLETLNVNLLSWCIVQFLVMTLYLDYVSLNDLGS